MHCLVVGRTLCGKSLFAKKKIYALKKINKKSLVLDPTHDQEFHELADFCTADKKKFIRRFWNSRNCVVFIDEAGIMAGRHDLDIDKMATTGRHAGHKIFFICQRAKQISVNIRSQCSEIVCFRQSANDMRDLSDEFVEKKLLTAENLDYGEFLYVRNNKKTLKLNVFDL